MNTATSPLPHELDRRNGNTSLACRDGRSALRRWLTIDRTEWQLCLRLGVPIMMTVWINMGMSVTDAWMVSRLGPQAMAAVAVGSDVYSIVLYFFTGVLGGLMPALACAVAERSRDRVRQLWLANWTLFGICLLGAIPALWFAPTLLSQIGVPESLLVSGQLYTRLLAFNLVPQLAICVMRSMLVAHHRPRVFFRVALCALPLNALLDAMFIHGFGPVDAMGVSGAGLATLLTSFSIALALGFLIRREAFAVDGCLQLRRAATNRRALIEDCRRAVRVGIPIGATALAEVGIFLGATIYIALLSVDAVAAHTLTLRLAGIAYALPLALGQIATLRVAQVTGHMARSIVIRTQFQLATCSAIVLGLGLVMLAEPAAALLDDGSALGRRSAETAGLLILLLALIEVVESFATTASGLLRGREDTFIPMVFSIAAYWAFSLPLALWLVPRMSGDAEPVWVALLAGMCLSAALLAARLHQVFATRAWPAGG